MAVRNRLSAETDALFGIEIRSLPDHALDGAGAADALLDGYLSETIGFVIGEGDEGDEEGRERKDGGRESQRQRRREGVSFLELYSDSTN